MAKSNYGQIKKYENEILAMKEAGYTKRRIAEELALTKYLFLRFNTKFIQLGDLLNQPENVAFTIKNWCRI